MALAPASYSNLAIDFDRPRRYYPPFDFQLYPYLANDPRIWWPLSWEGFNPRDQLVMRRVRNQLIQSSYLDWKYPLRWDNYYIGERVHIDENGFRVELDVRPFRLPELDVKTEGEYIVVRGYRKERDNSEVQIERRFVRKYLLPRGFNPHEVVSDLAADGILIIKAPPPPPPRCYGSGIHSVRIRDTGKLSLL